MEKITFQDINENLCDLDTEYREALAKAVVELDYISDTPLNLSYGSVKQRLEWEKFNTKPLSGEEIINIIKFMQKEMKGDFQYGKFKEIASMYLDIAKHMQEQSNDYKNGMKILETGNRENQPVALVERTFNDGKKEYIIGFNYEIKDNSIEWGYGYYYSDNIKKAKDDFNRVLNGGNLDNTFQNDKKTEEIKKEFKVEFYTEEEIKELIRTKAELYYVDDGIDETIIKLEDIPDFIVDYNRNLEMRDLKFFSVNKDNYEPDIITYGEFLNKIDPLIREKIIDRLIALQTNELEIKEYKIIDEEVYSKVRHELENEKTKKQKNKGVR